MLRTWNDRSRAGTAGVPTNRGDRLKIERILGIGCARFAPRRPRRQASAGARSISHEPERHESALTGASVVVTGRAAAHRPVAPRAEPTTSVARRDVRPSHLPACGCLSPRMPSRPSGHNGVPLVRALAGHIVDVARVSAGARVANQENAHARQSWRLRKYSRSDRIGAKSTKCTGTTTPRYRCDAAMVMEPNDRGERPGRECSRNRIGEQLHAGAHATSASVQNPSQASLQISAFVFRSARPRASFHASDRQGLAAVLPDDPQERVRNGKVQTRSIVPWNIRRWTPPEGVRRLS